MAHTMTFPQDDEEYQDQIIENVVYEPDGSYTITVDGWSFHVDPSTPVAPKKGDSARFYSKGIGYVVRGLFINGQQVFYRTEQEYKKYNEEQMYGKTAQDVVDKWDKGETVWSITLGGTFGPGYEQAIHHLIVEMLRALIKSNFSTDESKFNKQSFEAVFKDLHDAFNYGFSGAQWSVAKGHAYQLYMYGPVKVMTEIYDRDRHIQVSKNWPHLKLDADNVALGALNRIERKVKDTCVRDGNDFAFYNKEFKTIHHFLSTEPGYDKGYKDGESSLNADYHFALTENTNWPEDKEIWPSTVAAYIKELEAKVSPYDEGVDNYDKLGTNVYTCEYTPIPGRGSLKFPNDMDPQGYLVIHKQDDGDICMMISTPDGHGEIEFCTPMIGGGRNAALWRVLAKFFEEAVEIAKTKELHSKGINPEAMLYEGDD